MTHPVPPAAGKGGRPPKFADPSRPVTVTLPLRVLDRLGEIDSDRAKAIVAAVDAFAGGGAAAAGGEDSPVRELPVNRNETLLSVADNRFLRSIPWLTLVPIAPGRHLLSLRQAIPIEKLEVTIGDLIDTASDATDAELSLLRQLLERLRTPRRNRAVRSESILVIRRTR